MCNNSFIILFLNENYGLFMDLNDWFPCHFVLQILLRVSNEVE